MTAVKFSTIEFEVTLCASGVVMNKAANNAAQVAFTIRRASAKIMAALESSIPTFNRWAANSPPNM